MRELRFFVSDVAGLVFFAGLLLWLTALPSIGLLYLVGVLK